MIIPGVGPFAGRYIKNLLGRARHAQRAGFVAETHQRISVGNVEKIVHQTHAEGLVQIFSKHVTLYAFSSRAQQQNIVGRRTEYALGNQ